MRPTPPPALVDAAAQARGPLTATLASYPAQGAPGVSNTSNQRMKTTAIRANNSAARSSVLRDYLATV